MDGGHVATHNAGQNIEFLNRSLSIIIAAIDVQHWYAFCHEITSGKNKGKTHKENRRLPCPIRLEILFKKKKRPAAGEEGRK